MYLSDYIKDDRKGHVNFEFVDVQLDSDNRIFIDPVVLDLKLSSIPLKILIVFFTV